MRIPVLKTYKLFIGGAFLRSESGRVFPVKSSDGKTTLASACRASRKDLRDAVLAARKASAGWTKKTPYNRGQILYRMAEMLEQRATQMIAGLTQPGGTKSLSAKREVQIAIDRLIWYAGWADKVSHLFGTVNPVASPHLNLSVPESTGVVCVFAPDEPSLLGLISLIAPIIITGNTAIVVASQRNPFSAIDFAEVAATSDLPAGVLNILTGFRSELIAPAMGHLDIDVIVEASGTPQCAELIRQEKICNVNRIVFRSLQSSEWFHSTAENPYWILDTLKIKTIWHPVGL